jgi:hypothetical protein
MVKTFIIFSTCTRITLMKQLFWTNEIKRLIFEPPDIWSQSYIQRLHYKKVVIVHVQIMCRFRNYVGFFHIFVQLVISNQSAIHKIFQHPTNQDHLNSIKYKLKAELHQWGYTDYQMITWYGQSMQHASMRESRDWCKIYRETVKNVLCVDKTIILKWILW